MQQNLLRVASAGPSARPLRAEAAQRCPIRPQWPVHGDEVTDLPESVEGAMVTWMKRPNQEPESEQSRDGLDVLFEDDDVIVLNKPAGLPTANAPRNAASLFTHLTDRFGPDAFLGVVSRLDQPVSGVVIFAKTRGAAASLAEQFRERTVTKEYLAVVEKRFPAPLGRWVTWQDRLHWHEATRRAVIVDAGARRGDAARGHESNAERPPSAAVSAVTMARVSQRAGEVSLVELRPETGRRHQLRVQLAAHGCPIVGDRLYGGRLPPPGVPGQGIALHARQLAFDHPRSGCRQAVSAVVPAVWETRFPRLFPGADRSVKR